MHLDRNACAWIDVLPCLTLYAIFECHNDIVPKCEYVWCECEWMRNVPISFDLHCHRMLIYKYNKNNCSSLAIHEYYCPANACTYFVVPMDGDSILHLYRPLEWWIINEMNRASDWRLYRSFSMELNKMLKRQMINATHMITHKSHTPRVTEANQMHGIQHTHTQSS